MSGILEDETVAAGLATSTPMSFMKDQLESSILNHSFTTIGKTTIHDNQKPETMRNLTLTRNATLVADSDFSVKVTQIDSGKALKTSRRSIHSKNSSRRSSYRRSYVDEKRHSVIRNHSKIYLSAIL